MQKSSRFLLASVVTLTAIAAAATTRVEAKQAAAQPTGPTSPGQAAFGALSEIVRILESDPATDWSKVDIEGLRQHLIDMDLVTLHAAVAQRAVPGGFEARVTGQGPTIASIKRMVANQSRMLDMMGGYAARNEPLASGARVVITVRDTTDTRGVARLRALGFFGVLAEGDHHTRHHMSIARGDSDPHAHR